jgi:hypothetical protein
MLQGGAATVYGNGVLQVCHSSSAAPPPPGRRLSLRGLHVRRGDRFGTLTPPCGGILDGDDLRAVDVRDPRCKALSFEDVEFATADAVRSTELGDFECATLAAAGRLCSNDICGVHLRLFTGEHRYTQHDFFNRVR